MGSALALAPSSRALGESGTITCQGLALPLLWLRSGNCFGACVEQSKGRKSLAFQVGMVWAEPSVLAFPDFFLGSWGGKG